MSTFLKDYLYNLLRQAFLFCSTRGCISFVLFSMPFQYIMSFIKLKKYKYRPSVAMLKWVQLHYCILCTALWLWYCMKHTKAALTLCVLCWVLHPPGCCCRPFVSQEAAAPGHYSNHMLDLCPCLMFHGFIKGDESGSQRLGRERGECEWMEDRVWKRK